MGELSAAFGFLFILKDSLKLVFKNGKFMAPITLLSLLLPSIPVLLFSFIYQIITNSITKSAESDSSPLPTMIAYLSFRLLFEIVSIIVFVKISNIFGIATILVSATSYTDTKISSQRLYSRVKATARRSSVFGFRTPSITGTGVLAMLGWMVVIFMAIFNPNPITISIAVVVGVSVFIFQLHASVPTMLSHVVSVVEEKFDGSEALEKAEELVQGMRHHGFIISLFFNVVLLIIFFGFWLVVRAGRLWSLNVTEYLLFFIIFMCLVTIYIRVAYTVFYFQCKKYHGEKVVGVGNFDYTNLPASDLGP